MFKLIYEKVQLKTTSKQPKKYIKTASKLLKNYAETFGIARKPSLSSAMYKRRPKKTTQKLLNLGWTPPPCLDNVKKWAAYFSNYFPYLNCEKLRQKHVQYNFFLIYWGKRIMNSFHILQPLLINGEINFLIFLSVLGLRNIDLAKK